MADYDQIPTLDELLAASAEDDDVRDIVRHNVNYFKRVHGGRRMARAHRLEFNPRDQYWFRPERRMLVGYLAQEWHRKYAPAAALRRHALRLFRHFDQGRQDGRYDWATVYYEEVGGWEQVARTLLSHAEGLPDTDDWRALRGVWHTGDSAAGHLAAYIDQTIEAGHLQELEPAFKARLSWFPYLDCDDVEQLPDRQRFFFGYVQMLTSTNAYHVGGAQTFASVIQNTPSDEIMSVIEGWPDDTTFMALARDLSDRREISHYATVIELFGFTHLHRMPFINSKTREIYRDALDIDDDYALMRAIGEQTRQELTERPEAVEPLAQLLDASLDQPWRDRNLLMEGLDSSRAARRAGESEDDRIDERLYRELDEAARAAVAEFDQFDRAMCAVHLLRDGIMYLQDTKVSRVESETGTSSAAASAAAMPSATPDTIMLPTELHAVGEKALAYLHAGMHVLFAGVPGTGKTTLAQIVGYAWNHKLDAVPDQIDLADAPLTTVGNSAWAPFHTIGGLMPDGDGGFRPHSGIFIDPDTRPGTDQWQLRSECIVLDEMNRADLDRCIGELYPLLSRSVREVHPAGIPGVRAIADHPRFRVLATVNDATLDDIVFPISEGLERRFVRIELYGAAQEAVSEFLQPNADDEPTGARHAAAIDVVRDLFTQARDERLLVTKDEADRLPFGVGYFTLLRRWVNGRLVLPGMATEPDPDMQARMLLRDALTTLTRDKSIARLLDAVDAS